MQILQHQSRLKNVTAGDQILDVLRAQSHRPQRNRECEVLSASQQSNAVLACSRVVTAVLQMANGKLGSKNAVAT